MTDFLELAARAEAATGPDRELDTTIHAFLDGYTTIEERKGGWIVAVGKGVMERSLGLIDPGKHSRNFTPQHHDTPRYTASLDAAMTLVPEGWRIGQLEENWRSARWHCHTTQRPSANLIAAFDEGETIGYDSEESEAATPALALCAAALRAHVAKEGE